MKRAGLIFFVLLFLVLLIFPKQKNSTLLKQKQSPIAAQFTDKSLFLSPIKQTKQEPSPRRVTGITVPHHLLATDLIAQAFSFASGNHYDQILLVSPDHFDLGTSDVSVSERDFTTVFGDLATDLASVEKLEELSFVRPQTFFYREHGLEAELPFIKYYFPDAKILALTFKESTSKEKLSQVVEILKRILDKNSLAIQSTDFSHYLTAANASGHDEQTLKVLQDNDVNDLFNLNQPDNTDSIASQYVQMRLQKEFFGSKLEILAHKNSQDYTRDKIDSTTSYIVQGYIK